MKNLFSTILPVVAASVVLVGCSKDDGGADAGKLTKSSYVMYQDDTFYIEGENISNVEWDSENEFVATVEDGVITGQFVGETIVTSGAGNLSFSVEVRPQYHIYDDPYMKWGASKAAVMAKLGAPYSEGKDNLAYMTTNTNAPLVIYMFENDRLVSCGVACKTAYRLSYFLMERYVPVDVDVDNYSATLLHCYGKKNDPQVDYGVMMTYNSTVGAILVVYSDAVGSKASYGSLPEIALYEFNAILSDLM